MKRLVVGITAVLLAAGIVYLPSWGTDEIGQMEIQVLAGQVAILRDGDTIPVEGTVAIKPGDDIASLDAQSAARLRLQGRRFAWIGSHSRVRVLDETSLDLRSGSLKVSTEEGDGLDVTFDDILVAPVGDMALFRVDLGSGFARTASYAGEVELSRPGQRPLTLTPLFEAAVAGGELPLGSDPYTYDRSDPWDREHLASVIELDENLENYATSLSTQLDLNAGPTMGYFKELAGRDVRFIRPYLKRPTDDLLIGFAIAENTPSTSLQDAFETAFEYHDDGGQWGVVATIVKAKAKPLLAQLRTIVLATGVAAGGDAQQQPDLTVAAAREATGGSDPGDGGSDPGDGGTDPGDGGTDPGDGGTDPGDGGGGSDPDDCQDGVDCTGDEAIDLVCGGENPPPGCPEPSPAPEDDEDEVLDSLLPGQGDGGSGP